MRGAHLLFYSHEAAYKMCTVHRVNFVCTLFKRKMLSALIRSSSTKKVVEEKNCITHCLFPNGNESDPIQEVKTKQFRGNE